MLNLKWSKLSVNAGADAIVIGTLLEKGGKLNKLSEIAKAIQGTKK